MIMVKTSGVFETLPREGGVIGRVKCPPSIPNIFYILKKTKHIFIYKTKSIFLFLIGTCESINYIININFNLKMIIMLSIRRTPKCNKLHRKKNIYMYWLKYVETLISSINNWWCHRSNTKVHPWRRRIKQKKKSSINIKCDFQNISWGGRSPLSLPQIRHWWKRSINYNYCRLLSILI
jgi:hypothetical protein